LCIFGGLDAHMKRPCQAFAVSQPTVVLVCPVMHVFRGVLAGVVH
jgi:hypothetical protein